MKAAVYRTNGGPEVLSYEDVPDPVAGAHELLVRVEAISIEGGDLLHRRNVRPRSVPHVVGYAAAGEILAVGTAVRGFAVGQKVTTFGVAGSHGALRAVRADQAWVVPEGLDMATAATIPVGTGTADFALFELGQLRPDQTVLVLGAAGGVGLAAVQLAHLAGARVIGTSSSAASLEALRAYGLDDGILLGSAPFADAVRALTGGRGVDLVLDPVGGAALQQGVDALAEGGRCVMIGLLDPAPHVVDASRLMRQRKSLMGCMLGPVIHERAVRPRIDALLQRAATGELRTPIDATFPLAQAEAAHRRAQERGRLGRVVMVP